MLGVVRIITNLSLPLLIISGYALVVMLTAIAPPEIILTSQKAPVYPPAALAGRIDGNVTVSANIVDASFQALLDAINWKLIRDGARPA